MNKSQDKEKKYFLEYLSLAPVLAVISISVAFSTWAIFNYIFPDLLFHPLP
ncbi:PsaJ protein [Anabaena sp. FACHB-709]|uniref:PsaJ-like protein asl3190 n=2 Tax=Nostocaceae TaxID=1162 RepID=PSAJL_NOSS1|nr:MULTISPECIES: PsaJ asl3190 [Nostocaceae]P58569.1 RecName: Full=PsaJ-like protein asl3190 [Nostoc sp. PCC 7120 = FACHB-418]HBW33541.1 PsaJ protein [Nostoc sp. UBA8866]MBD2170393.1 PsaJ protein [Anabaena cylindrica FACHB-318]MBD2262130.1 PsaJ protein [Anabaena sp. FACHB-709]MBD2271726.1 PsaJ protein [Nostoc sp. PCC 7120 = FACHB-418]MBD2282014.1 PsaJ protein [Anabaena cylindrica FACHB-170]